MGYGEALIGWHDKSLWTVGEPVRIEEVVGSRLFDGPVTWPAMILRDSALRANVAALADFTERHGMLFAPHGKTSMSPELFRRQLDAGAWGITAATAHQAVVALRSGVANVLIAHQVLDDRALDVLAGMCADGAGVEVLCLVDSPEGVARAAAAGRAHDGFRVLLDVGFAGGRTGVRTADEALELAGAIAAEDGIELAGASCYEGGLATVEAVGDYLAGFRSIVESLRGRALLPERAIVTAGGSAYFDVVADELSRQWAHDLGVRVILRSGAYVSHDDGVYGRKTPFRRVPDEGALTPAIEVWAQVVSAPEPGLVLVGMGKRDAPYDEGMPVARLLRRAGRADLVDVRDVMEVTHMDDQHAYVRVPADLGVRPGDLLCFGISHPCTAFDKWRTIPVVDDGDLIVDVIRTFF